MPTMSTKGVDATELAPCFGNGLLHLVAVAGVGRPRDAVDLGGDVVGQLLLVVDAEDARPDRRQGVGGLAADALAGADHDHPAPVEADPRRVVGDFAVVDPGHLAVTVASARWPCFSSSGMISLPRSSIVRMTDSWGRWPNCT